MRTLGIDVSHWQNDVDWFTVAKSDVKFAFAKATDGTKTVDAQFSRNWSQIQEVGLFRGAYHYGHPGQDPESQAVHFSSVVGSLGFRDLPPVLDLEEADGHPAGEILEWARAFVKKAESLFARQLIVYSGYFWRGPMKNPNDAFFRERLLWLPAYGPNPVVPASWNKWTFWQYTEGTQNAPASIPGVRPCDQNWFDGSESDLAQLCAGAAPQPEPPPPAGPNDTWPGTYFVWPRHPAMTGPGIEQWQKRMGQLKYVLDADGVYGPESKAACIALQRDRGLSADGIVGRATWEATFADAV
jgi:lysozyme